MVYFPLSISQLCAVWYNKGKTAIPFPCVSPELFGMALSKWVLLDLIPKGEIEDWIAGIQPYLHKCDIARVKLNIRNCALCRTETSASGQVQGWYKKQAQNFLLPGLW